jgi:ophiobolin F synthase
MSFPLVHALNSCEDSPFLRKLLQQRQDVSCLSDKQKRLVLDKLNRVGSIVYTRETLEQLQRQIYNNLKGVEDATRRENWILRALLQRLEVCDKM